MELLIFLFVVFLITVIGHGIWVGIAAIWRTLVSEGDNTSPRLSHREVTMEEENCPACHAMLSANQRKCHVCGLNPTGKTARELRDIEATRRVLARLVEQDEFDIARANVFTQILDLERRRLLTLTMGDQVAAPDLVPPPVPSVVQYAAETKIPPIPHSRVVEEEILDAIPVLEEVVPAETKLPPVLEDVSARVPSPTPVRPPVPVPEPARPLSAVLMGFMESKNILWGELVGGLLIVGCSIALVLSLWNSLQQLPYFPFLLFSSITAALFGAGVYTLHHWKLESTSRGLLAIALLLAPMNLLVLADPSTRGNVPALGIVHPLIVGLSFAFFGWLVWTGGRDLIGAHLLPGPLDRRLLLALAIVGTAGSQIFTPGLMPETDTGPPVGILLALAAIPSLGYLLTTGAVLGGLTIYGKREERLTSNQSYAMFGFLGLALFALLASFAFLQWRDHRWIATLPALALPLALAGIPGLTAGLLVHRRFDQPEDGTTRTVGTGVTLVSLTLMLIGVCIAWPHPLPLLLATSVNAVVLTTAAYRGQAAWLHAGALPCVALAVLTGSGFLQGTTFATLTTTDMIAHLTSARSAVTLAGLVSVLSAFAIWLDRTSRRGHAIAYVIAASSFAVVALFVITPHGLAHPIQAAITHGILAITGLAVCTYQSRHRYAQPGAWLLIPTTLWALQASIPGEMLWWSVVVACEGVVLLLSAFLLRDKTHPVRIACQTVGSAAGLLAVGLIFTTDVYPTHPLMATTLALLAGQLFLLAGQTGIPVLSSVGSFIALGSLLIFQRHTFLISMPLPNGFALVLHAVVATLVALVLERRGEWTQRVFARPLEFTAKITSLGAVPLLLLRGVTPFWEAGYFLVVSALWLLYAWRKKSPEWFMVFQGGVSTSLMFLVRDLIDTQGWFPESLAILDPRVIQLNCFALGLLGLVWVALRRVEACTPLWPTRVLGLDRILTTVLVVGTFCTFALHIVPPLMAEWFPEIVLNEISWWVPETFDTPGWLCLSSLLLLLLYGLHGPSSEREANFRLASVGGVMLLTISTVLLWSGTFSEERAAASAVRWGLGSLFLVVSTLMWYRHGVGQWCTAGGFAGPTTSRVDRVVRTQLSFVALVVFLLTAVVAQRGFAGLRLGGPDPDSIFANLGFNVSHLVPLVFLVVGLAGNALRERSEIYAFLGCLLTTITVMAGYALSLPRIRPDEMPFIMLLGIMTSSAGTVCWLLTGSRLPRGGLLYIQACAGPLVLFLMSLPVLGAVLTYPTDPWYPDALILGQRPGWAALLLAGGALFLHARLVDPPRQMGWLTLSGMLAGVFMACMALVWESPGRWLAYRTLALAWSTLGILAVGVGFFFHQGAIGRPRGFTPRVVSGWMTVLGCALCFVAFRGYPGVWKPWLPCGVALVGSLVLAGPGLWYRDGRFAYLSGPAMVLAGFIGYLSLQQVSVTVLLLTLSVSLATASVLWSLPRIRDGIPFSQVAAPTALLMTVLAVLHPDWSLPQVFTWITLGVLVTAFYLERHSLIAGPGYYTLLLTAFGVVFRWLDPMPNQFAWSAGVLLTLHVLLTSTIGWWYKERAQREWAWYMPAQLTLTGITVLIALRTSVSAVTLLERLTGALMLGLLTPATWLVSDTTPSLALRPPRWLSPTVFAVTLGLVALAIPTGVGSLVWLERTSWLLLTLTATSILYLEWSAGCSESVLSENPLESLRQATRGVGQVLFVVVLVWGVIVIGQMIPLFDAVTKRTPLHILAILGVMIALFMQLVMSLRMALLPDRDPLRLSETGRQGYVYLAEVLLVMMFVHARLNIPELFMGPLGQYWTVVVMIIAFLGVGLSELFERQGLKVLSVPLQRTGVFLPLVPLLAFWARPTAGMVELAENQAPGLAPFLNYLAILPWNFSAHALIWFLAGGLYMVLALSKQSSRWGLTAALAMNFGLWAMWSHMGLNFYAHPQVWLIPLGLIILISEHLERESLSKDVASTMRYLGICLIYVASTAELFLTGLGNSLWLPVILAVLCVAGVLTGIWLRVKAFLFLGVGFLLVDLGSMIWHAAVDRSNTWVWWASGIVLGIAILALFAMFEKRRNELLLMLDEFKRWE